MEPHLKNAAAPAPSSLAGGERMAGVVSMLERVTGPTASVRIYEHEAKLILAALSPEAPARDDDLLPEGAISGTDDGQTVWLESHTGGAHELGVWGGLSLRFEEADGSHSVRDYVDTALTPRHEAPFFIKDGEDPAEFRALGKRLADTDHEAPAEGAGEALLQQWVDAFEGLGSGSGPLINSTRAYLARARSSAPEAREGEADWWWVKGAARLCGEEVFSRNRVMVAAWEDSDQVEIIPLYTHPAAPSADKLRIAVEALGEIKGLLSYASQDAVTEAVAQGNRNLAWHKAEEALAALKAGGAK